jgi:hypothetical protein
MITHKNMTPEVLVDCMSEVDQLNDVQTRLLNEGLEDMRRREPILADIIAYRLIIARLGESDNNGWWDSRVLSEFGEASLDEVVPKTVGKRRVELAQRVGKKVESEKVPDGTVSLFGLSTGVEARVTNVIKESEVGDLSALEELDMEFEEQGWSTSLAPGSLSEAESHGNVELGEVSVADLENDRGLESTVESLVSGYGKSTKNNLCVPYLGVENE